MTHFTWTAHPVGCVFKGDAAGDVRAEIWLPSWEGRESRDFIVKMVRPGHPTEYSSAPTIPSAKDRAEAMLTEALGQHA